VQCIHTTDAAVFDSALSVNMGRSSKSPLSPRMPVLHLPSRNVPQNTDLLCPLNFLTAISANFLLAMQLFFCNYLINLLL